ncbi:hypothetical protein [Listeria costaricensis]|uniref:hypothetical protein n=1 Tax=Listeria costaricensis TaxID=2026604 RepID=UPI000C07E32C|nr:hypothetical protein [Listeria costaricensis]
MKIKETLNESITSKNSYEESVENIDILTEKMDDDFVPYRVEQNVMMWLNQEGLLGEIECIFPTKLDEEVRLVKRANITVENGFPLINTEEIIEVPEVKTFVGNEYFVLYFSELTEYDRMIVANDLSFYLEEEELIAIKAVIS